MTLLYRKTFFFFYNRILILSRKSDRSDFDVASVMLLSR